MNYEKVYYKLFNEITDIIEYLTKLQIDVESIIVESTDFNKIDE